MRFRDETICASVPQFLTIFTPKESLPHDLSFFFFFVDTSPRGVQWKIHQYRVPVVGTGDVRSPSNTSVTTRGTAGSHFRLTVPRPYSGRSSESSALYSELSPLDLRRDLGRRAPSRGCGVSTSGRKRWSEVIETRQEEGHGIPRLLGSPGSLSCVPYSYPRPEDGSDTGGGRTAVRSRHGASGDWTCGSHLSVRDGRVPSSHLGVEVRRKVSVNDEICRLEGFLLMFEYLWRLRDSLVNA